MNNDITFCLNRDCPVQDKCRRAVEPEKEIVSMAKFQFEPVDDGKEVICSGWWRMEENNEKNT
jgi:hypothetical protein